MIPLLAQMRFPAPEFENYTLPQMGLEAEVPEMIFWRLAALVVFLVLSGIGFYHFRSRRAMLLLAAGGWFVFGFWFSACPCSVGMFQNIAESAVVGTPIPLGVLLLFAIPLACALFWGRLFCTGACPLGAVQEWLHWKNVPVPLPVDRVLRMVPVLVLTLCTVMAASGMGYYLCRLDPWLPMFFATVPTTVGVLTLILLATGLFVSRPFCRYLCPYGVLLRFFTLFSPARPQITPQPCIRCRLCEQGCPNGAILPPEPEERSEVQKQGLRRLSLLVACVPFALFFGGLLGTLAAPAVSSLHRDVRLWHELRSGAETKEVEAFEVSGTTLAELHARVLTVENRVLVGMCLGGIFLAGCGMAELIANARHRREEEAYRIVPSLCFCCGRCYTTCPLNRQKESS